MKTKKIFIAILILTLFGTTNAMAGFAKAVKSLVKVVIEELAVDAAQDLLKQGLDQAKEHDPNGAIRNITMEHFNAESRCDVEQSISFYDDVVYYEGKDISKSKLRKLKNSVCSTSSDKHDTIRNNNFVIGSTNDRNIKTIDYETDYDVYDTKHDRRLTGTTRVRLAIRTDTSSPKIMGEIYKKLY